MLKRTVLVLAGCLAGAALSRAGCLPVLGNRILGRDLREAEPRFEALPGTLTIGYAPAPGTKRVFKVPELQRIARANGIHGEALSEICFELAMRTLSAVEAETAMRRALPAGAILNVVELPVIEIPAGEVEFPLTGLEPSLGLNHGVQLWRGAVLYAETRRAPVWARVEVTVQSGAVIATRDLAPDIPIDARWLRLETRTGPIAREKFAVRLEDVQGRVARRGLKSGMPIPVAVLTDAPAVRRGDAVPVEVESGLAHVRFEAIAETTAGTGEMVELRNPVNGKTFRAKLNSDGKAVIVINAGHKL